MLSSIAAVAASVLVLSVAPSPASAASPAVEMRLGDSTLVGRTTVLAGPVLSAARGARLTDPVLTFDFAGLAGIAEVSPGPGAYNRCRRPMPARLVCTTGSPLTLGPLPFSGLFRVELVAVGTADPGDSGPLTVTLTDRGERLVGRTATVRVAEPVGLTAAAVPAVRVAPGDPFELSRTVEVTGATPVRGITVLIRDEWAFQTTSRFRNCRYTGDRVRSCRFDDELRPGTTYRLTMPFRLRRDSRAPATYYSIAQWLTTAEADDLEVERTGRPGDRAAVRLTEAPAPRALPQADPERFDNSAFSEVVATGRQGFDFVAVADLVAGADGDRVTVRVGVHNAGPATADSIYYGENVATLDVRLPAGTIVLTVPPGCRRTSVLRYRCSASYFLRAGTRQTFDFGLKIATVCAGAAGRVTVFGQGNPDTEPGNDRAAVTIVAAPAGGGDAGGSDARCGGAGGGGDAGAGGGLPITGPSPSVPLGAGLLLLTAGAILLAAGRRVRHSTTESR